jgi:hypothetical protein
MGGSNSAEVPCYPKVRQGEAGMRTLPEPEVLGCYFDEGFSPHLAAMHLRWPDGLAQANGSTWSLPGSLCLYALPDPFGLRIQRWDVDAYATCLLWGATRVCWSALTRTELLASDLGPVLAALGSDLRYYLDQQVERDITLFLEAN